MHRNRNSDGELTLSLTKEALSHHRVLSPTEERALLENIHHSGEVWHSIVWNIEQGRDALQQLGLESDLDEEGRRTNGLTPFVHANRITHELSHNAEPKHNDIELQKEEQQPYVTALQQWSRYRAKLIFFNRRLVANIAKKFAGLEPFNDLYMEGVLGLHYAMDRFSLEYTSKFSTYASFWVRQAIQQSLSRSINPVYVSHGVYENLAKRRKFIEKFMHEHEREPTQEEIIEHSGLKKTTVENISVLTTPTVYLDKTIGRTEEGRIAEISPKLSSVDRAAERAEAHEIIMKLLPQLKIEQRCIVALRHGLFTDDLLPNGYEYTGEPLIFDDIANIYQLTRERIRQIYKKAIQRLTQKARV